MDEKKFARKYRVHIQICNNRQWAWWEIRGGLVWCNVTRRGHLTVRHSALFASTIHAAKSKTGIEMVRWWMPFPSFSEAGFLLLPLHWVPLHGRRRCTLFSSTVSHYVYVCLHAKFTLNIPLVQKILCVKWNKANPLVPACTMLQYGLDVSTKLSCWQRTGEVVWMQ